MEKITQPILVVVDHKGEPSQGYTLTGASAKLLTLARNLTEGEIITLALNINPDLDALSRYGGGRVLLPVLGDANPRVAQVVSETMLSAVNRLGEEGADLGAILLVSNFRGKEVAGRMSIVLNTPAATDVTEVNVVKGQIEAKKSALSGTWEATFHPRRTPPVIALSPGAGQAVEVTNPAPVAIEELPVAFTPQAHAVAVEQSQWNEDTQMSLADASVVVCVGRGMGSDLSLATELAEELGGALGATRVVCDEGHAPRSIQIGQTGLTVAPRVYIGLGVSGAVHHTSAIQGAGKIFAICDDGDAPIFQQADVGILGRIEEVLPQLLTLIRAEKTGAQSGTRPGQ